ncbi:site-specific DNA-methyltransferase [Ochrobactrum sp. MYb15]|nr:site-specific DNA-methyltransferase [Ochrobactrum sp. MYb19]PRA61711.1 site-specific DNA-methyltransferase [Ochrobactrum sp. MYb18]PRA76526.1 site-specific DNA-methyltransferase [Brucella thiophenivorans]PRA85824.1 site-specific DNA-methyltransferase [Ochrobactrum sp. MYb14]PRA98533.1 site-specific DNA-methyltransferase [Ochrobactrum sp. MYb15]
MPILRWLTREDDVNAVDKVPYRLLEEVPELGYGDRNTENMLIQGDNLDALKALLPFYAGQIKCIYIDPPYNTKSAFEHYDDNLEHSQWLAMMWPRLEMLRDLLTEDGSIWISIDDTEAHYLKVIGDEVFGRKNFILSIAWQKRDGPPNDRKIGLVHEHILVWAKHSQLASKKTEAEINFNLMPRSEKANSQYAVFSEPDGPDPRGPFRKVDSTTNAKGGRNVASLIYPLKNRFTGKEVYPRQGRNWVHNRAEMERLNADNRLYWGVKGTAGTPMKKLFLTETKQGMTTPSVWSGFSLNQHASAEMEKIFGEKAAFETPKPEGLLERILTISTNPGDLVLDSFLGSGTTAAVAHKMGRRYIGIEMGEHAATHCQPRLVKVVDGEQGGISESVNWQGGGGFRFYKLGATVFDKTGQIRQDIKFPVLAAHIWFAETRVPWSKPEVLSPVLGEHDGRTYALLYNGILGDKSVSGGNVLTRKTLSFIRDALPDGFSGPLTVYGERSALSETSLAREQITFKQTPYDVKARA